MKFLHLADLHLGRRIGEIDLLEDQRHILTQILEIADREKPDAVLIAGDVYDRGLPSAEAVTLLDDFLTALSVRRLFTCLVCGNHDSPERLNFGGRIFSRAGIHIAGVFDGALHREMFSDEYGGVSVWMLPFVKPALVQPYCRESIDTYDAAVRAVVGAAGVDAGQRNILVAHQFVTAGALSPERCDSETIAVGGVDQVDVSAFNDFDYVALGHLHGPQRIGRDAVRYAGSPLKYSFSESRQHKSVTVVELHEKGSLTLRQIPLTPLHEMRVIKGPLEALLAEGARDKTDAADYIHAVLTDEGELFDAVGQLRQVYPNLLGLELSNSRTATAPSATAASGDVARKTPMELFEEFYQNQNGAAMTGDERRVMEQVFTQAGGDGQ